jgi:hypothetical protein
MSYLKIKIKLIDSSVEYIKYILVWYYITRTFFVVGLNVVEYVRRTHNFIPVLDIKSYEAMEV